MAVDAINDPLAAVSEVKTGLSVFTAQECTSDTAGDTMVVRCVLYGDLQAFS